MYNIYVYNMYVCVHVWCYPQENGTCQLVISGGSQCMRVYMCGIKEKNVTQHT